MGMVWSILAAIPLLALLALWLIRFHYLLEYESPARLRLAVGVRFLGWKKTLAVNPIRALWGAEDTEDRAAGSAPGPSAPPHPPAPDQAGQRGALGLPDSWIAGLERLRARFRKAGVKWMLDPGVWRLLLAYGWRSGKRILWFMRPRLESVHLGLENAYDLARAASAWSAAQATVPALACPVTYGFGASGAELRLRLGGRFTGLGLALLALASLTSFPFGGMFRRFAQCWRDPELTRWQRRVLLP